MPGRGLKNFLREGVGEGAYYINFFSSWGREGSKTGFWEGSPPLAAAARPPGRGQNFFSQGEGSPPLTHFPKSNELNFKILKPLGTWTWIASIFTLFSFLFIFCLFNFQHLLNIRKLGFPGQFDMGKITLHVLFQYQQPAPLLALVGTRNSGRILIVFISIMAIYWHTLYDVKVRSFIIGQTFEPVAESLEELDVSKYPVYNLEEDGFDEKSNIIKVSSIKRNKKDSILGLEISDSGIPKLTSARLGVTQVDLKSTSNQLGNHFGSIK